MALKTVVIGMLGVTLDRGGERRWNQWRPTLSLLSHEDLVVDRLELIHQRRFRKTAEQLLEDAAHLSPETEIRSHTIEFRDAWDFEEVYSKLLDFADGYRFDPDRESYLVHMTTGTHVAQICLYLMTEARYIPAKLLQTSPPPKRDPTGPGTYSVIDLDLSKYDAIASRFATRRRDDLSTLKSGIETRNRRFNALMERIERVSVVSKAPVLLTGKTGVGKSRLARRIFELKKRRRLVEGELVEVNCATLRGDGAMSTLFGHSKGAFTGAQSARKGLLLAADRGLLFLDEIGELGLDEQAMLLRAIENKSFLPMGSDREASSDFQLIAGTNRDLRVEVQKGTFREDLLARINVWTFDLPELRERTEDIEPNLEFETSRAETLLGHRVAFNREARARFLDFAYRARWSGNFRDFRAAVERMATLAGGERINESLVEEEIDRLEYAWSQREDSSFSRVEALLGPEAEELDLFDRAQLEEVLRVCRGSKSMSDAGRKLFAVSRSKRSSKNDSDRVRKYLHRFGISWQMASR
ncbi:MAG: RNA repair transcriptional activator RtcR [Myxococcota bacterium]